MKIIKRALLLTLAATSFLGLAACGETSTTTTVAPTTTPSVAPTVAPTAEPTVVPTTTFDKDAKYRSITESLPLTKGYAGKNYIDDGIGSASLVRATDGDTANFLLKSPSKTGVQKVTIRFSDIDTPESTGQVQKWGKAAAVYCADRLNTAYDFVLEAEATPATMTGVRYLAYVWYRESATDTYKNLCLEMVENGYTSAAVVNANLNYKDKFQEAEKFAKKHQMHVWSTDTDKYYTTDPISATVIDVANDWKLTTGFQYFNEELEVGSKIALEGILISREITSSGWNYYELGEFDENGNLVTVKLSGSYSSDPFNSNMFIGSYCHIVGTVQDYYGEWQIAVGGTYSTMGALTGVYKPGDSYEIQKAYYCTFDSNKDGFDKKSETGTLGDVTVTSVTLDGTKLTIKGLVYEYAAATSAVEYTFIVENATKADYSYLLGATISTKGIQTVKNSKIIYISERDIVTK